MSQLAIFYGRCSTKEQSDSGLGLDAQKQAVKKFAKNQGYTLGFAYTDVATGSDENREGLSKALKMSAETGAPIIVSKLDRLSRRVHFISGLMESGTRFIVVDLGREVDTLVLHIFAAFAEEERRKISQRTKDALAMAKARGTVLGNPNLASARVKANAVRAARANNHAVKVVVEMVTMMKAHGRERKRWGVRPMFIENTAYPDKVGGFQPHKLVHSFPWMCPGGSLNKHRICERLQLKTRRGAQYNVVGLNRTINRVVKLLDEAEMSEHGATLKAITLAKRPDWSRSNHYASRTLQELEWSGKFDEVFDELLAGLSQLAFWGGHTLF